MEFCNLDDDAESGRPQWTTREVERGRADDRSLARSCFSSGRPTRRVGIRGRYKKRYLLRVPGRARAPCCVHNGNNNNNNSPDRQCPRPSAPRCSPPFSRRTGGPPETPPRTTVFCVFGGPDGAYTTATAGVKDRFRLPQKKPVHPPRSFLAPAADPSRPPLPVLRLLLLH